MFEAEQKRAKEAEKQVRKDAKEARRLRNEQNIDEIARTVRLFPDMTRAQMDMFGRFMEQQRRAPSRGAPSAVVEPLTISRAPSVEESFVTPDYFFADIEADRIARENAERIARETLERQARGREAERRAQEERDALRKREIEANAKATRDAQARVQERMAAARVQRDAAVANVQERRRARQEAADKAVAEQMQRAQQMQRDEERRMVPAEIVPPEGAVAVGFVAPEEEEEEVPSGEARERRMGADDLDVPLSDGELSTATSALQVASERERKPLSLNLNSLFGTPGTHLKTNLAKIRDMGPQKLQNRLNNARSQRPGQLSQEFETAVERIIQMKQQKREGTRKR
jgi:hypothetical protein